MVLRQLQAIASERGLFQFGDNVAGIIVFAMAAEAQQVGDDQLRAAAGAGAGDGGADDFEAGGQISAVHGMRLDAVTGGLVGQIARRRTAGRWAWNRRIGCWRRRGRAAVFPRRPGSALRGTRRWKWRLRQGRPRRPVPEIPFMRRANRTPFTTETIAPRWLIIGR